jgi:neutral trehalase
LYLYFWHILGGIPSSLERDSNEQWDFPNGWAPQQHLFVASLLQCKDSVEAVDIARRVGEAFLKTALNGLFNPMQGKVGSVAQILLDISHL